MYAVTAGRGQFTGGGRTVEVAAGSVLFVPAGEAHRFHDITEDLAVLVFFGPAFGPAPSGMSRGIRSVTAREVQRSRPRTETDASK